MKNTFFSIFTVLVFATAASAQSTVDSIASKYQLLPMPEALTLEKTFPVIGQYQAESGDAAAVTLTISLDSTNKGIVWVDGSPLGRFKAYMKKAPATYRIPAQKTTSGKSITEGTMIFDRELNALNIAIGGGYNESNPVAIFQAPSETAPVQAKAKVKSGAKTKIIFYTGTKTEQASTASTAPVSQ